MQAGTCEQLRPFKYYSLEEFEYKQLISKGKGFVGLYVHLETKVEFVIKEVPYLQKTVQMLQKIQRIRSSNLVGIRGACLLRCRLGWADHRLKSQGRDQRKEAVTMLLFMQKQEMNLHEHVNQRRKTLNYLREEDVRVFYSQMLEIFTTLQRSGIAHRDVKPENILIRKGNYLLCDFEDAVEVKPSERTNCDLTTVQYSSPEYLRHIRHPKEKYFDPFKLDVYSFGLTLLFVCSMGKFSLQERANYIYESSEHSHADFIKQQRIKWVKNQPEFKSFNDLIKLTLQEDQYKRDDFLTLGIKTSLKNDLQRQNSLSDDNSNPSRSSATLKPKPPSRWLKSKREAELQHREMKVYGMLTLAMMLLFILFCLF